MITGQPKNWKDLQDKVSQIFNCIGLNSEKEKKIETPRGTIALDVYAVDPLSVDKIKYVVECKNWNTMVPQTVIHSFTTVLHETGANIGYLISKVGFQKGAAQYANSTNIKLFTYEEFQKHYFEIWYKKFFSVEIFNAEAELIQFTEPFNSRRERYQKHLDENGKFKYEELLDKYSLFSNLTIVIGGQSNEYVNIFPRNKTHVLTLCEIESALHECFNIKYSFSNYIEALDTIKSLIKKGVKEFIELFGRNIFID